VPAVVGVPLFAVLFAAGALLLFWYARRHGLLAPLVVGALLRLGVMVGAHIASVAAGDGGFMFSDDRGFDAEAERLAAAWDQGEAADPRSYQYVGSYVFGYPATIAAVYVLVGPQLLVAKLLNVLFGAAVIVASARLAEPLAGARAARRAAWFVAFAPTLVWWTAPLLREAAVTLVITVALAVALRLPSARAAIGLGACFAALILLRIPAALAVAAAVAAATAVALPSPERRQGLRRLLIPAAIGILIGGVGFLAVSSGDVNAALSQYASTAESMVDEYRTGGSTMIPVDVVRSLVAPYPWVFDSEARTWYMALYPGMWFLYFLLPTAALGVWRLRRTPELWLLAIPILVLLLASAVTAGFTIRQRSGIEPLLLVLAVCGFDSWRRLAIRGAVALSVVAVVATLHTLSPLIGLAILAVAVAAFMVARLLPGKEESHPVSSTFLVESASNGRGAT
jgi:4-amino-4-deoxy-L-arabinose transferase-like glycosyltransferase